MARPKGGAPRRQPDARVDVPLADWRQSYRVILGSNWYLWFTRRPPRTKADRRHAAFMAACAVLLPTWYQEKYRTRFLEDYYRQRQDWLNLWRPLPRGVTTGVTTGGTL